MVKLEAKAAALTAINRAKHAAAGKTHRLVIELHDARSGEYAETKVFYCAAAPTPARIGALILKHRGSISASTWAIESLQVA